MKYIILFIIAVALAMLWYTFIFQRSPLKDVEVATSFVECLELGNPAMESYPRQCIDAAGNHFTEVIDDITSLSEVSYTNASENDIVSDIEADATIASPLTITGMARGYWFFEASFPVILTDWEGEVLAEGFATAANEWMTTEFVPFVATLTFTKPGYGNRGTLVLRRDNPSDLPQNDSSLEIPVYFE